MKDSTPEIVSRYENETWSRCAESYPDTFHMVTSQTLPLLVKAADLRDGRRVLDLGPGPGDASAILAETGASMTGIDFSRKMVEVARRRHPAIPFHEGDGETLPFDGETFDAVVANCVVHHLARPAVVFKEVARVLQPGGRFAFVVWGALEEQTGFGVFFAAVQANHSAEALPHGPLFGVTDRAVYETPLREAGLQQFHLVRHEVVWRMQTLAPLLRGLWDWGNLAVLPREVQERIEAAVPSAPGGSWGGQRPSVAAYVAMTGAHGRGDRGRRALVSTTLSLYSPTGGGSCRAGFHTGHHQPVPEGTQGELPGRMARRGKRVRRLRRLRCCSADEDPLPRGSCRRHR